MRMISVITNKIRNRINEFTDLDLNIAEFYDIFQNYFVDVFDISNILNFKLYSSELSDVQMMNDNNASAAAVTEKSESAINIIKFTVTSVLDNVKMILIKQIMN